MTEKSPMPLGAWPAAMNKKLAALYCGMAPETFEKVCPVKPISFTGSSRGERYLRQRIDEWLLRLDPNEPDTPPRRRFGDAIKAHYDGRQSSRGDKANS